MSDPESLMRRFLRFVASLAGRVAAKVGEVVGDMEDDGSLEPDAKGEGD